MEKRAWILLFLATLIASLYNIIAPWLNYTAYHDLGVRGTAYVLATYLIVAVNYLILFPPVLNVLKGDRR